MYMYFVLFAGYVFGTAITLRQIKVYGNPYHLTVAGKIVFASIIGVVIAVIVTFIDGMWWNCDSGTCKFIWGY